MRSPRLVAALLSGVLVVAGCSSSSGEQVVFTVATGFWWKETTPTGYVLDAGLPDLHNLTGQAVRLRSVSLVAVPASVHLLSATGYLYSQTHGEVMGGKEAL